MSKPDTAFLYAMPADRWASGKTAEEVLQEFSAEVAEKREWNSKTFRFSTLFDLTTIDDVVAYMTEHRMPAVVVGVAVLSNARRVVDSLERLKEQ